MKLYINILVLIFLLANCIAQSDFRNGYIINNFGDTVYGQIDYKWNRSNAKECIFIKNGSAKKIKYSPSDISGYRFIDSKYFVTRKIKRQISRETGTGEELLFLEYLIHGKVDIYYYHDNIGDHYFIDSGDGNLIELKNDTSEVDIDNVRYEKESKQYIGVLKHDFEDAPAVSKEADGITLSHKSLIKIAKDYHNAVCTSERCIVYEKKIPKLRFSVGIPIGIGFYKIKYMSIFNGSSDLHIKGPKFKYYPAVGLLFKINMPSLSENIYLQYEILYSRRSGKCNVNYVGINYRFSSINNTLSFRYEYPKGKIGIVLQGGIFVDNAAQSSFSINEYIRNISYESSEKPFASFDYGVDLGCGGTYKINNKNIVGLDVNYQLGHRCDQTWIFFNPSSYLLSLNGEKSRILFINLSYIF